MSGHSRRKIVPEKIAHFCVGLPLILKGIDKAEHFREHPWLVIFLFAAGAFILLGAAFEHQIEKRIPNFARLFHVAEGLALIAIGVALLEKSSRIPYFFMFAGVAYLAIGIFEFVTTAETKKRLEPRFVAVMGAAFLLFAAVAAVLNTLGTRNAWAYITSGVIAVVGAFMLIARRKLF
jgi:drug/metabolite transporter (DMT)-like permease